MNRRSILLLAILMLLLMVASTGGQEQAAELSRSYLFTDSLDRLNRFTGDKLGVQELSNMKRPSPASKMGWRSRSGTTRLATNPISGITISGIYRHSVPDLQIDTMFLQGDTATTTAIYQTNILPPNTFASFGTALYTINQSGVSPLLGQKIGDDFIWAGAGTTPFAYSGASAWPDSFMVTHESGSTLYVNGYDKVRDNREDTHIVLMQHSGTSEVVYIGFRRRLTGLQFDFLTGATNSVEGGVSVYAMRGGTWTHVSNLRDTTKTGTTSFWQSGHLAWDYSALDQPYLLPNTTHHYYFYKLTATSDFTDSIKTWRVKVNDVCEPVTNLWSGLYYLPTSFVVSSGSGGTEYVSEVITGNDANYANIGTMPTTQSLYVGSTVPLMGVYFQFVPGYVNQGTACTVNIAYWNGSANTWTSVSGATVDGTSAGGASLNHTGAIQWDGSSFVEDRREFNTSLLSIYYYRFTWSATLPANIQIWDVGVIEKPRPVPLFPTYDFVLEYNGMAAYGPGFDYRHGIDLSETGRHYVMNGERATSTGNIFGPGYPNAAVRLYSYAVISTKDPPRLYVMEGKVPGKYDELLLSDKVGAVGPRAMVAVNDAVPGFSTTRSVHSVLLMAHDGIYMTDGMTLRKVSEPIGDYWDSGSTPYVEPRYAHLSHAVVDYRDKTVTFFVPLNMVSTSHVQTTINAGLVYNYILNEWYDTYTFAKHPSASSDMLGSDNQNMTMFGTYDGYVLRSNTGNTDFDGTQKIVHYVRTSDFIPTLNTPGALNYQTAVRNAAMKALARSTGSIEVVSYPDGATSGVTPINSTVSMINSGKRYVQGKVTINEKGETHSFRLRSGHNSAGEQSEMYGITIFYKGLRPTDGP